MNDELPIPDAEPIRSGVIAVVGRANVGKSTLLNGLLDEKVSIVSPIAQTTRNLIRAVYTNETGQLVFVDTPGMHKATGDLGRLMNRMARNAMEGADVALLVLDGAEAPREEDLGWMRRLVKSDGPVLIFLNKSDRGAAHHKAYRGQWDEVVAARGGEPPRVTWLTGAAREDKGLRTLRRHLFESVPFGPLLFPEDMLSDFPRKLAMADVIREKMFAYLQQELPHAVAVFVSELDDSGPTWKVDADIYVNRNSQKGIVIGPKGRLLKRVKREAEKDLSEMFDCTVDLNLWVKVRKDWAQNFWLLRQLGYQ